MLQLSISARSHTGLVRPGNEDMILVEGRLLRDESYEISHTLPASSGKALFAIADGMGGHNAGEVASEEAARSLAAFFQELPTGLSDNDLIAAFNHWLQQAHLHLLQMGTANPAQQGMGTTLVGLCLYEGRCFWFNCGDSRIYHMHGGILSQLSTDHSYEQMTGIKGRFPHAITNCLGANSPHVFLDMVPIRSFVGDDEAGEELWMLCSDGLSDLVDDSTIARFLAADATAPALVRLALNAGGRDNVSVCLVRIRKEKV